MKISIVQTSLVWENKSQNLSNLDRLISPLLNSTDIVILPEMFNTGFSVDPHRLSELPCDETFIWMEETARKGNFGLCGSYIVCDGNNYYNRLVFVSPEKEIWYYDKRHLFSMGNENESFSKGKKRLIFSFRGLRISPFICYDLRFPVWSRNRNDCDLIIYAANWPAGRSEAWNILLRARAIENQCYVAGANIIGTDGEGIKYNGDSLLIDPRGIVIASGNQKEECLITGEISLTELSEFRKKFPVLNDADDFTVI